MRACRIGQLLVVPLASSTMAIQASAGGKRPGVERQDNGVLHPGRRRPSPRGERGRAVVSQERVAPKVYGILHYNRTRSYAEGPVR